MAPSYHEDSSSSSPEDYEYETTSEQEFDIGESPADLILQQEPFVHFRSLNNYLNNLNLATFNFNLNNRFNAFVADSPLWKLYENSPHFPIGVPLPKPPKIDAIANLWRQLGDHDGADEAENIGKRLEFERVRKRASEEVQRRLGPKINQKEEEETIRRQAKEATTIGEDEEDGDIVVRRGKQETRGGGDPTVRLTHPLHRQNRQQYQNHHQKQQPVGPIVEEVEDPQLTLNQEFWSRFLGFKTEAEEGTLVSGPPLAPTPPINPFYSRFYLSTYDKLKVIKYQNIYKHNLFIRDEDHYINGFQFSIFINYGLYFCNS